MLIVDLDRAVQLFIKLKAGNVIIYNNCELTDIISEESTILHRLDCVNRNLKFTLCDGKSEIIIIFFFDK